VAGGPSNDAARSDLKAITKQLSWVQAAEIVGVTPGQMRRPDPVEGGASGLDVVMDQRGGRPRRKRILAGTIELPGRQARGV
jgi:hypothetical protein